MRRMTHNELMQAIFVYTSTPFITGDDTSRVVSLSDIGNREYGFANAKEAAADMLSSVPVMYQALTQSHDALLYILDALEMQGLDGYAGPVQEIIVGIRNALHHTTDGGVAFNKRKVRTWQKPATQPPLPYHTSGLLKASEPPLPPVAKKKRGPWS